jgi:hypothetical protein
MWALTKTLSPWQDYIYIGALCCNYQYSEEKRIVSLHLVSMCSTFITMLIMRDGEEKVRTAGNMFYNTLSARQALRRHRRWSHRRHRHQCPCRCPHCDYFNDVDIPDVVSGTDLLPLLATNLHYINMHRHCQSGSSTTMPNALRGMYLLTTALRGTWGRSNWHLI